MRGRKRIYSHTEGCRCTLCDKAYHRNLMRLLRARIKVEESTQRALDFCKRNGGPVGFISNVVIIQKVLKYIV